MIRRMVQKRLAVVSRFPSRSILALTALALTIAGGSRAYAARRCFDLKGVAAADTRGGIGVGGDNVVTDIPAGTTACAAMTDWKANWDAIPGNESGPVTMRPDGTCDWCVTLQGGAKPTDAGSAIGYLSPGFSHLSSHRVANPPPPPPPPAPPARVKITIVIEFPAGGTIQIIIELAFGDIVQPIRMQIPTFAGDSPDDVNARIAQTLEDNGFSYEMGSGDLPAIGKQPTFDITGHVSGATIVGGELETDDAALDQWGLSYQPEP